LDNFQNDRPSRDTVSPKLLSKSLKMLAKLAGDAALFIDAYSVESIAQGILKMASDKDLRQRLTSSGYK
jgi:hypothetical protein